MIFNNNKLEEFINNYYDFLEKKSNFDIHDIEFADKYDFSQNCEILYYNVNQKTDRTFLIVSSIFNSPEIFFINSEKSFISNLQELGAVYLIKWHQINEADFGILDYANEITKILNFLSIKESNKLDIIGHCIGGTITTLSLILSNQRQRSLALLTSPFDFSHFQKISNIHKYINLDAIIQNLDLIPKLYIKILFFLLFPEYFNKKLEKFFNLDLIHDKNLFLQLERWLMSGTSLPRRVYFEIVKNLMDENKLIENYWYSSENFKNFINSKMPVCQIIAKKDALAPLSSILFLHNNLNNSTIFKVNGGHINYLIGKNLNMFFKFYSTWLGGNNA